MTRTEALRIIIRAAGCNYQRILIRATGSCSYQSGLREALTVALDWADERDLLDALESHLEGFSDDQLKARIAATERILAERLGHRSHKPERI